MRIKTGVDATFGTWRVAGHPWSIEFPLPFWDDILTSVMEDFLDLPWGGPETGGVLFGTWEPDGVRIVAYRPLECEHAKGPSFELSNNDEAGLRKLLEEAQADEGLTGLEPVGWYLSKYHWFLLTPGDVDVYDRYFPAPWQVTMVFLRAKAAPCRVGFFFRRGDGSILSSQREFGVELAVPEIQPEQPPTAPPVQPEPDDAAGVVPAEVEAVSDLFPRALFGLEENPFSESSHRVRLYWSRPYKEILGRLLHGVRSRRGLKVLTGEAGTGKSTLLECLGDFLTEESIEFAFLLNSPVTSDDFYEMIADDLELSCGSSSKAEVLRALNELFREQARMDRTTALLVDDAQNLEWDVLEEIRLIDNLQNRQGRLVQTVLSGLPELDGRLEADNLRQLRQRIALRCHLQPLRQEETIEYIEDQMAKAGIERQTVFSRPVMAQIHAHSGGVLRVINAICGGVLDSCFAVDANIATADILERICAELKLETDM